MLRQRGAGEVRGGVGSGKIVVGGRKGWGRRRGDKGGGR